MLNLYKQSNKQFSFITITMTPEQHNFVEHIAKEQIKYESIFTEQANVLQADLKGYQVAMTQIKQPPLIAKCGQCQESPLDEVD
jgi:hypothetical protein